MKHLVTRVEIEQLIPGPEAWLIDRTDVITQMICIDSLLGYDDSVHHLLQSSSKQTRSHNDICFGALQDLSESSFWMDGGCQEVRMLARSSGLPT